MAPQERCKSCYAFATNAAVEAMTALATGDLIPLSEQNIVDCSSECPIHFVLVKRLS